MPIHWGTYASPGAWLADPARPAREFERLAAEEAPGVDVRVVQPGERVALEPEREAGTIAPWARRGSFGA